MDQNNDAFYRWAAALFIAGGIALTVASYQMPTAALLSWFGGAMGAAGLLCFLQVVGNVINAPRERFQRALVVAAKGAAVSKLVAQGTVLQGAAAPHDEASFGMRAAGYAGWCNGAVAELTAHGFQAEANAFEALTAQPTAWHPVDQKWSVISGGLGRQIDYLRGIKVT